MFHNLISDIHAGVILRIALLAEAHVPLSRIARTRLYWIPQYIIVHRLSSSRNSEIICEASIPTVRADVRGKLVLKSN